MTRDEPALPTQVEEFAQEAVGYVRRAVGILPEWDSETLPIVDHYLRGLDNSDAAVLALVVVTQGAYFGEVVRRHLGGRWQAEGADPTKWRVILPTGLSFCPAGVVAEAIAMDDMAAASSDFHAPPRLRPSLENALENMGDVTVETYYSLSGRFDTLEHLQQVLLAVADAQSRHTDAPN